MSHDESEDVTLGRKMRQAMENAHHEKESFTAADKFVRYFIAFLIIVGSISCLLWMIGG